MRRVLSMCCCWICGKCGCFGCLKRESNCWGREIWWRQWQKFDTIYYLGYYYNYYNLLGYNQPRRKILVDCGKLLNMQLNRDGAKPLTICELHILRARKGWSLGVGRKPKIATCLCVRLKYTLHFTHWKIWRTFHHGHGSFTIIMNLHLQ